MARRIVLDEFHLTVLVPRSLPRPEQDAALRALSDPAFEARLLRAARRAFRAEPALALAKVRLSRRIC